MKVHAFQRDAVRGRNILRGAAPCPARLRLTENDHVVLRELLGWTVGRFPLGSLGVKVADIARSTGLHRNTVLRRLRALEEGGVLDGFLFEPHPHVIGVVRAGHHLDGVADTDAATVMERLADHSFVTIASVHLTSCFVHTYHDEPDDIEADVAGVAEALGARDVFPSFRSDLWPPGPADTFELTALDRRLLVALRRGPRRSAQELADELSANRRSVARRLDALGHGQAGAMMPLFRPGRIDGHVIAIFEGPAAPSAVAPVREHFPVRIMGPHIAGERLMTMVPLASLDEAARHLQELRAIEGLEALQMRLMRDVLFPEACDAWLAERVQNAPPGAAKS